MKDLLDIDCAFRRAQAAGIMDLTGVVVLLEKEGQEKKKT